MLSFLVILSPLFNLQSFRHLFTFPFLLYNDFIPWEGVLFAPEELACQQIDQQPTACGWITRDRLRKYFLTSPEGRAPGWEAGSRVPGGDDTVNRGASATCFTLLVPLLLRRNNWSGSGAWIGLPQRLEEGHS
jgi:hypothetical protein